jgi:hypothetical protein
MNTEDFYKLSGMVASRDWTHLKKELAYRYGICTSTQYFDAREFTNTAWTQPNFKYTFNQYGFRDSPVQDTVDTCYYGCSISTGIGVPEESRWTNLLDQQHTWTSNNFAIPGLTVEDCFLVFAQTARLVKMKRAVFFLPDTHRAIIAAHTDNNTMQYFKLQANFCQRSAKEKNTEIYNTAELLYRLPAAYFIDRARTAINLIRYTAELYDIQVILSSWNRRVIDLLKYTPDFTAIPLDDRGRDLLHPGTDYHGLVAEQFGQLL